MSTRHGRDDFKQSFWGLFSLKQFVYEPKYMENKSL
jgi:hypothetical protein